MKLRNGNNQKNENTIQVGIMGIDVASEGPLSKKHKASYISITVILQPAF